MARFRGSVMECLKARKRAIYCAKGMHQCLKVKKRKKKKFPDEEGGVGSLVSQTLLKKNSYIYS